jgi:hypothetical protein
MPGMFCACGCGQEVPTHFASGSIRYIKSRDGRAYLDLHQPLGGARHYRWNGGKTLSHGYIKVFLPSHPTADCKGYTLQHRVVAEQMLGRLLCSNEVVHHLNGDRADNRPENLQVMLAGQHRAYHFTVSNPRRKTPLPK